MIKPLFSKADGWKLCEFHNRNQLVKGNIKFDLTKHFHMRKIRKLHIAVTDCQQLLTQTD